MSRYEYCWITLNDGVYTQEIAERVSCVFEILINEAHLSESDASFGFIASGVARELQCQNVAYAQGMSGLELAILCAKPLGIDLSAIEVVASQWSPEGWAGRMLALFQIQTGCTYEGVFRLMGFDELRDLYFSHEEDTPEEFCNFLSKMLKQRHVPGSRLKKLRTEAGFTQSQLACKAGLSLRSVQQYEQGIVSINNAAAGCLYKMSMVLQCPMEDLLDLF